MDVYLNALGVICALGQGKAAVADALFAGDTRGIAPAAGWLNDRSVPLGGVHAPLPSVPPALTPQHDNRNNRLLMAAAQEIHSDVQTAIANFGRARIGVVLGTSTTGIEQGTVGIDGYQRDGAWPADYSYTHQELAQPATFVAQWLDLGGPAYSISTACTSSARALMSARRLLRAGVCDAVLCGGVDTLARMPIQGFAALEAIDAGHCTPFSANRRGINIGEAAAVFLMTAAPAPVRLVGAGASSDAHHMSSPHPQGLGARAAMLAALDDGGLAPEQIDYLNLHGTATELNDRMESLAVHGVFSGGVLCSSTKSLTGHTLGAAGALEAAFCWLSLTDTASPRRLPPHIWDGVADAALPSLRFCENGARLPAGNARLMSNSFAFGGNNACLILGDAS